MPRLSLSLLIGLGLGFVFSTCGSAANLSVQTDLECRLSIDGKPQGVLKTGASLVVKLDAGEHQVEAAPVTGEPAWEDTVNVTEADSQTLKIPLLSAVASARAQSLGYWTDPDTRLTWAAADNGVAVTYSHAAHYCQSLSLASRQDWTLPTIDDLYKLFGGAANKGGYRIRGPLKLTGWEWSASPGNQPGEQFALDFGDGGRASAVMGDSV